MNNTEVYNNDKELDQTYIKNLLEKEIIITMEKIVNISTKQEELEKEKEELKKTVHKIVSQLILFN